MINFCYIYVVVWSRELYNNIYVLIFKQQHVLDQYVSFELVQLQ